MNLVAAGARAVLRARVVTVQKLASELKEGRHLGRHSHPRQTPRYGRVTPEAFLCLKL